MDNKYIGDFSWRTIHAWTETTATVGAQQLGPSALVVVSRSIYSPRRLETVTSTQDDEHHKAVKQAYRDGVRVRENKALWPIFTYGR